MKENDLVLKTVTRIVIFIILTFGFYLFLAGHNNPGGGFIAGLILSSAFILMFLAFDVAQVLDALPIDFRKLMIIGALVS
ncbi:MnhB domain-containing protein, partial [Staphylococcus pseudintermedius]